jgi:hypothetical protein
MLSLLLLVLLLLQIEFGGTCHISGRPYTVFRWRPGNDARYKKTIICQEVAKAKNVCQVRSSSPCHSVVIYCCLCNCIMMSIRMHAWRWRASGRRSGKGFGDLSASSS